MAWITPQTAPTDTICRSLFIPNDEQIIANVTGALQSLTYDFNYSDDSGGITPAATALLMRPMFNDFCFNRGVCRVIGEIIPYASDTSPDPRWITCDGASLLRADFPDLFTVIGTAYGSVDATHFNIPDLRGRVPLGDGTGTGLSTYALGNTGGEEAHTLTTPELAVHTHIDSGHVHGESVAAPFTQLAPPVGVFVTAIPAAGITGSAAANIQNAGSGNPHENRQPYLAINYLIVALP